MTYLPDAVVQHLRDVATWPDLDPARYSSVRPLGAGGMGRVFAARDHVLDRDVAIKVSHATVGGSDLDERLRGEARVLASLEHPGIVPVHELGVLGDGRLFYVMKLVHGHTLEQDPPPASSESAVLSVFERVVDAVAFAHARGVIHRDLKPANIMRGPFGEVLVMDWGVAALLNASGRGASVRVGTPGFMSPEQATGGCVSVGPPSDVYALGALLSWLLSRDAPQGAAPRLDRRLRAILAKCVSPQAADRYADAGHLAADLARYRAGEAVEALPETVVDRARRFVVRHRALIGLLGTYLVMRALVAWWQVGRP